MHISELSTPALWADLDALEFNLTTMAERIPGTRLRPHVKAHKMTALARRQHALGHTGFTCATPREVQGLVLGNRRIDVGGDEGHPVPWSQGPGRPEVRVLVGAEHDLTIR